MITDYAALPAASERHQAAVGSPVSVSMRHCDCHRDLRANRRDDCYFVGYTDQTGVSLSRAHSRTLRHLSEVSPEEDFNRTFCLSYCIQISLLGLNILCTGHGSRGGYGLWPGSFCDNHATSANFRLSSM